MGRAAIAGLLLAALASATCRSGRPREIVAGDRSEAGEALLRRGYREMMAGRTLLAIPIFDRARDAGRREKSAWIAAYADAFAAVCLMANGRRDEARSRYRRAVETAGAAKAWKPLALALEGLSRLERKAGDPQAAAARAVEALDASLRAADLAGAGLAVELVVAAVGVEAAIGRADLRAVLGAHGRAGHPASELSDLVLRAGTAVAHHAPAQSRRRMRLGLRLAEAARDDARAATALSNLGYHEIRRGRLGLARQLLEMALERARKAGDPDAVTQVTVNLALAHKLEGHLPLARRLYGEALEQARRRGKDRLVGILISNLSRVHEAAGDFERALAGDLEALGIHRRTGPPRAIATDLNNVGSSYHRLGRLEEAERAYREARFIAEKLRDHDLLEAVLLNLGYLQKTRGRPDEARALYVAALDSLRKVGKTLYVPVVLNNLAWLDADGGRCADASGRFRQAFEAARRHGDLETAWSARYGEAVCARRGQDTARARRLLEEALALIERQRAGLGGGSRGAQFFAARVDYVYRDAVDLALVAGDARAAFELAERARARTLLEALAGGRAAERGAPAVMRRWLRDAARRVAEAERALAVAQAAGGRAKAMRRLEEARRKQEELLDSLRAHSTSVVVRKSLAEVQARLPAGAAILEYVPLRDRVAIFVVLRDRVQTASAPIGPAALRELAFAFRRSMERAQGGDFSGRWKGPLRKLHAALVAPVRGALRGVSTLYVVPSGVLNLLPFAALLDGDRPLVEDFAVAILPAASALAHVRKAMPRSPRVLVVGNPAFGAGPLRPLPAAEAEAQLVARLFPGAESWIGAAATEARLKRSAAGADILHLATHGEPNAVAPAFSALHLAPGDGEDGRLEVHELLELDLRAALVVLSACQTAVQAGVTGALPAGEEFVGLVAGLLEAGASSVLATLWAVADASTAALMERFYEALSREGRSGALRSAQRALRQRHPHPFFWAPFVLVGDGS